jgi:hypothetical protein
VTRRWLVERTRDSFDDVGAENVRIESGCLVFRDGLSDSEPILIYAAGQWLTVCQEEE